MTKKDLADVLPRGTLQRFATAGGVNSLIFWILWELLRISPLLEYITETGAWAVSWIISCTIAHFVHRFFTFDGRRDIKKTMLGAFTVYSFGGALSTLTYNLMYNDTSLDIRLIFGLNLVIWGIFTWACMRWLVFGYKNDESPAQ